MEILSMSRKELDRLTLLSKVQEGLLTQVKASEILEISDRQIRNLLGRLNEFGPEGLTSKRRGKPSNRKIAFSLKESILKIIQEQYADFGPTLAAEKLQECHHIFISKETIRRWLIEFHLWIPKIKKRNKHPLRKRKECFGEMIQGDASSHDWFENNHPCALLVFIDDATSRITAARFEEKESLEGYFNVLEQHLMKYGRPVSLYTDRFSVFESSLQKGNLTQFQRALKSLEIKWIGANSPQAKGRVERCNRTLQDRLVKELRIKGIKNLEEANAFLEEYLPIFNDKFSKEPMKRVDLHRPLERGIDLSRTLSKYEERTLTKDFTFQFNNIHYKVFEPIKGLAFGRKIEIRINRQGDLRVFLGNRQLEFCRLDQWFEESPKEFDLANAWPTYRVKPRQDHPWKGPSYAKRLKEEEIKVYNKVQ